MKRTNKILYCVKLFLWVQLVNVTNFISALFITKFYFDGLGKAIINSIALGIPIFFLGKSISSDKIQSKGKRKFSLFALLVLGLATFSFGEILYFLEYFVYAQDVFLHRIKVNDFWLDDRLKRYFISILFVSPILEEILFRGVLMNLISKKYKKWNVYLFISLIFTLAHIENLNDLIYILKIFILSIVLCIVYDRNKKISEAIFIHFVYNFSTYLFSYVIFFLPKEIPFDIFNIVLILLLALLCVGGLYILLNIKNNDNEYKIS